MCRWLVGAHPQTPGSEEGGAWPDVGVSNSTHLVSVHLHGHSAIEWDQQDHEPHASQDRGTQDLGRHREANKTDGRITQLNTQNPTET